MDLADGSLCLPDEVRIQLSGRRQLYNDKARLVRLDQHLQLGAGESVELPLRLQISDQDKLWVTRGDLWVPTVTKGPGKTQYLQITNVGEKKKVLCRDERIGMWLAGDRIPRLQGFVTVGSRRYLEWQNLALQATTEAGPAKADPPRTPPPPMVERPKYPVPRAILRRPDLPRAQPVETRSRDLESCRNKPQPDPHAQAVQGDVPQVTAETLYLQALQSVEPSDPQSARLPKTCKSADLDTEDATGPGQGDPGLAVGDKTQGVPTAAASGCSTLAMQWEVVPEPSRAQITPVEAKSPGGGVAGAVWRQDGQIRRDRGGSANLTYGDKGQDADPAGTHASSDDRAGKGKDLHGGIRQEANQAPGSTVATNPLNADQAGSDPVEDEQVCIHESGDLHAEDVEAEMAVLPEVTVGTADVTIEDIQVGDPEINSPEEIERLRGLIWKRRHLLIGKGNALPPPPVA
ncbi:Eukaryotic/viral aspartic protease, active site [Phytophthora cinnamomi]|uniref:Eukaryotic/viral aspartic protease, active site n=1 Tax=Phytophthora cinnamomi TaxID=4785 RepID=UPI003559516B|nr:Eukaryotic/viral aspartic protease, active site [Phytophthora cinnamomi]